MFINEQQGAQMWQKMLKENFNVTDNEKLQWISNYASIHEIHEAQIGINGGAAVTTAGGVNPIYTTPLNTLGMGNIAAPQNPNVASTAPGSAGNQWNQTVGSGDIPVSTLPMGLNIALMTIGLELLPVIPSKGPWQLLTYMDFPYAGGKLGRVNETAFDGKGDGKENKPIYIKVLGTLSELSAIGTAAKTAGEGKSITVTSTGDGAIEGAVFTGKFKGIGRMDGGILLETVSCVKTVTGHEEAASITEVFSTGTVSVTIDTAPATTTTLTLTSAKADFVQTSVDLIDGFANFATGAKEAMTRAQNETGTGNTIGLRMFSKWVQMGSYEVTGTVTRQQLQDLPLYGVDAVGKVMEALQNEITQHINQRIIERAFALGVTNAVQQKMFQSVDFNLYIGGTTSTTKNLSDFGIKKYVDIYGTNHATADWKVTNSEALTSAENTHTRQRRIASRILASANLIQITGRRGRANWAVTNGKIATALQDISSYVVAPMANTMSQDGSQNLYMGGTLAGLKIYVDPYMDWNDTRICVGRKGDGNSPGMVFLPYILADTVSITAEGTMAPKMLINSRFALAECGFFPETQYYTFAVYSDFDFI